MTAWAGHSPPALVSWKWDHFATEEAFIYPKECELQLWGCVPTQNEGDTICFRDENCKMYRKSTENKYRVSWHVWRLGDTLQVFIQLLLVWNEAFLKKQTLLYEGWSEMCCSRLQRERGFLRRNCSVAEGKDSWAWIKSIPCYRLVCNVLSWSIWNTGRHPMSALIHCRECYLPSVSRTSW